MSTSHGSQWASRVAGELEPEKKKNRLVGAAQRYPFSLTMIGLTLWFSIATNLDPGFEHVLRYRFGLSYRDLVHLEWWRVVTSPIIEPRAGFVWVNLAAHRARIPGDGTTAGHVAHRSDLLRRRLRRVGSRAAGAATRRGARQPAGPCERADPRCGPFGGMLGTCRRARRSQSGRCVGAGSRRWLYSQFWSWHSRSCAISPAPSTLWRPRWARCSAGGGHGRRRSGRSRTQALLQMRHPPSHQRTEPRSRLTDQARSCGIAEGWALVLPIPGTGATPGRTRGLHRGEHRHQCSQAALCSTLSAARHRAARRVSRPRARDEGSVTDGGHGHVPLGPLPRRPMPLNHDADRERD